MARALIPLVVAAAILACAGTAQPTPEPNVDVLLNKYRSEELAPTADPTQVALCPTWTRSSSSINTETNDRVSSQRNSDYGLTVTADRYAAAYPSVLPDAHAFATTYTAARQRRDDMPMPPATALVAAQDSPSELAQLVMQQMMPDDNDEQRRRRRQSGGDAPTLPGGTTLPGDITIPVNLTLPGGTLPGGVHTTLPDDVIGQLSNLTLPGGAELTLPNTLPGGTEITIPASLTIPGGIDTTLPPEATLPEDLATPAASEAVATLLEELDKLTLPGGIELTLPAALSGDVMRDVETMAKGETMRATIIRRELREETPQCFVPLPAASSGAPVTEVPLPPPVASGTLTGPAASSGAPVTELTLPPGPPGPQTGPAASSGAPVTELPLPPPVASGTQTPATMPAGPATTSAAAGTSSPATTALEGPRRAVDATIRLGGWHYEGLVTPSQRPALEAALREDLARLVQVVSNFIVIRDLRIGSLIVDFSVEHGTGIDNVDVISRVNTARADTDWLTLTKVQYATVSDEPITVLSATAAEGTPAPAPLGTFPSSARGVATGAVLVASLLTAALL